MVGRDRNGSSIIRSEGQWCETIAVYIIYGVRTKTRTKIVMKTIKISSETTVLRHPFEDRPINAFADDGTQAHKSGDSMLIRANSVTAAMRGICHHFSFDEHDAGNQEPGSGGDLDTVRKGKRRASKRPSFNRQRSHQHEEQKIPYTRISTITISVIERIINCLNTQRRLVVTRICIRHLWDECVNPAERTDHLTSAPLITAEVTLL